MPRTLQSGSPQRHSRKAHVKSALGSPFEHIGKIAVYCLSIISRHQRRVQRPIAHEFSSGDYSENARHRPCHTGCADSASHIKTAWRLCQPKSGFNPLDAGFCASAVYSDIHFSKRVFLFRPIQAPNRPLIQARELDKRPISSGLEKRDASPLGLELMTNGVQ